MTSSKTFTVRSDMLVKCSRCRARLRQADTATVTVDETGFVEYQHTGECPKIKPHVWGPNARVQGSTA